MVSHEAENPLIVVTSTLRAKCDDDSLACMGLNDTLSHGNREQIALISEELERGGQIAVIDDVEETVGCLLSLHFAELHCLGRELDVVTIGLTTAAELNLVAAESTDLEEAVALDLSKLRSVSDSYFRDLTWLELTRSVINLNGVILAVIVDALDCVAGRHKRRVLEIEYLAGSLANKQVFEVERKIVECNEWVLADGAHLENLLKLRSLAFRCSTRGSCHDSHDNRCNDDLGLSRLEGDLNFLLLLRAECAYTVQIWMSVSNVWLCRALQTEILNRAVLDIPVSTLTLGHIYAE